MNNNQLTLSTTSRLSQHVLCSFKTDIRRKEITSKSTQNI